MTWTKKVAITTLALAAPSCGLFGSDDGKSGSSGVSGTGAASGTGGKPSATCDGLPGPGMAEVAAPAGSRYCIDRTEVTQKQYQEFLDQAETKPGAEHADCSWNQTYQPLEEPSSKEGARCWAGYAWTPDTTPNRPVVCIDWCDAVAYCAWAGKRLCGKVGGGRLTVTSDADLSKNPALDANESQWFNACSQGGKTIYPYGDTYDPLACEGKDAATAPDGGLLPKKDVAARAGCRGTSEPFSSIQDLSGSVAEMTDECTWWNNLWHCAERGGAREPEAGLRCRSWALSPPAADPNVGFRCCKDLP